MISAAVDLCPPPFRTFRAARRKYSAAENFIGLIAELGVMRPLSPFAPYFTVIFIVAADA